MKELLTTKLKSRLLGQKDISKIFIFLLLMSLVTTLLMAPGTGDVNIWLNWIERSRQLGIIEAYITGPADYPPGSLILLWLSDSIVPGKNAFFSVKALLLASILGAASLFGIWFKNINAASISIAICAISAVGLGYLDILWTIPIILAYWLAEQKKYYASAFLFSISALLKWQPLIVLPFAWIHLYSKIRRHDSASKYSLPLLFLAISGPPLLASLVFGLLPILKSLHMALNHSFLSGNALNLPWLMGILSAENLSSMPQAISYTFVDRVPKLLPQASKLLFYLCYSAFVARYCFSKHYFRDLLFASLGASVSYCAFNIGVHENHWYLPAIISLIGIFKAADKYSLFVLPVLMSQINLIVFYGFNGVPISQSRNFLGVDYSIPLALLFLIVSIVIILLSFRCISRGGVLATRWHPAGGGTDC